ncbi:MAG: alanine racemase [Anaerolineae bacterium]|nr:alanine racemase [Anaerolineae bacterium]
MTTEVGLHKTELDTPVLWVELDTMEANIRALAAHFATAGVNWRPHIKGIKIPAVAQQMIAAGAIGVTCAKLGEAEVMAYAGIRDILIANQIVGNQKITRLVSLAHYANLKVAVDNADNTAQIGGAAAAAGVEIGVLIEVNTGMNRAGVAPGEPALALARIVQQTPGLRFEGLMAWEGHTLSQSDPESKRKAIVEAVMQLTDSAALCRSAGLPVNIVSGGGSGTYQITPFLSGITEIQAGGAIFNDNTYRGWGVQTKPALFVRSTVTSRPHPTRIIFDIGFKSAPAWINKPTPIGIDGVQNVGTSAEHGIVTLESPNETIRIGDVFDFVIGYTDATLFLHDQLYGIRNDRVEVVWDVQGRGKLR